MLKVTCEEVDARMPAVLRERVAELLIERGVSLECHWEGVVPSADELLQQLTEHVKDQHAMRSWPPEYWVHIRTCIRTSE